MCDYCACVVVQPGFPPGLAGLQRPPLPDMMAAQAMNRSTAPHVNPAFLFKQQWEGVYVCRYCGTMCYICLSAYLSVCLSVCTFVSLSVCLLSVCMSVCLSVCAVSSVSPDKNLRGGVAVSAVGCLVF